MSELNSIILGQKTIEQEYDKIRESQEIKDFEKIGIPFGNKRTKFEVIK